MTGKLRTVQSGRARKDRSLLNLSVINSAVEPRGWACPLEKMARFADWPRLCKINVAPFLCKKRERFPVLMTTEIGGTRPVETPAGELLPRIY